MKKYLVAAALSVITLGVAVWGSHATAAMLNQSAQMSGAPTCQVAEVNPVSGHTECIKPFGAPVETLPSSEVAPCPANWHSDGTWRYQPNCKSTPPG
jgi:hypothetical protein